MRVCGRVVPAGGSNLKYNVGLQAIVRPQIPPSPSAPSSGALGDKVDISKVADIGSVLDAMCDMMLGPTGRSVAMPISVGGHASSSAGAAGASPASSMRPGGGAPATGDLLPIQRHLSQAIDLHAALERTLTAHGIIMPFERQEMRVLPALAAMDIRGMASMPSALSGFASVLSKAIEGLEAQAHALAGHTFLVSSAKQCAEVRASPTRTTRACASHALMSITAATCICCRGLCRCSTMSLAWCRPHARTLLARVIPPRRCTRALTPMHWQSCRRCMSCRASS